MGDKKLPTHLIVGAAKAGTTSVCRYLAQHPQVFLPKVKESFFFAYHDSAEQVINGFDKPRIYSEMNEYSSLFEDNTQDVSIDGSTWYLYKYESTIQNIKKLYKQEEEYPGIVIILRNPVDRCISHYKMHRRNDWEKLSFDEAIQADLAKERLSNSWAPTYDYLGFGQYYDQVNAYLEAFDKVKVMLYDDFTASPEKFMGDLVDFFEISDDFDFDLSTKHNKSFVSKYPFLYKHLFRRNHLNFKTYLPASLKKKVRGFFETKTKVDIQIPDKTKQFLSDYYQNEISNLSKLINRDLSSWLK